MDDLDLPGFRTRYNAHGGAEMRTTFLVLTFQFGGDQLKEFIAAGYDAGSSSSSSKRVSAKPIHKHPAGHTWPHRACLTLIGDAAYLMTPSEEGANAAMLMRWNSRGLLLDLTFHPRRFTQQSRNTKKACCCASKTSWTTQSRRCI